MSDGNYGQRLTTWRKQLNLSQRALSSKLGVSRGYLGDIELGRSEPSRNFLQKLAEQFGVSSDWLLYGTGAPPSGRSAGFTAGNSNLRIEPPDPGQPLAGDFRVGDVRFSLVRRMELSASAGTGLMPASEAVEDHLAFSTSWLMNKGIATDLSALVRVRGDSMVPTIPDKALVLINAAERLLERPGIYAFSLGDEVFVKRLTPLRDQPGSPLLGIIVSSDNPAYPPTTITARETASLNVAGRVRAVLSSFE